MKHLQIFETETAFDAEKANIESPCIALTEDDGNVHLIDGSEPTPTDDYVDLGLPSGLKWAKCNIGADTEEGYGLYFQWGDVEGRTADEIADKPCDWEHAPFNNGSSDYDSSYFTAHKSEWLDGDILKPEYDAATQLMGADWRMPTKADYDELLANTTNEWTQVNGVDGRKFTSKTDASKYIFIPFAGDGEYDSVEEVGYYGDVWSSGLDASNPNGAYGLGFGSGSCGMRVNGRCLGFSVRGVRS